MKCLPVKVWERLLKGQNTAWKDAKTKGLPADQLPLRPRIQKTLYNMTDECVEIHPYDDDSRDWAVRQIRHPDFSTGIGGICINI